jgi:hypothetical protein
MAKKMKELLNDAYTTMQNLTIQATAGNVNAIACCLNNIQTVYNLLNSMPDGMEEDHGQVLKTE